MDKTERIKELVSELSKASIAYYRDDNPIMTDKMYDLLYDELLDLEKIGLILSNSPTQKVQGEVLDGLKKVVHSKPMLSAKKTKSIDDIINFSNGNDIVLSWKMDGLTIVLRYDNGVLTQAITRGTGEIGEDVTHAVKMFTNVPLTIPYKQSLELRGEGVISWDNFNKINSTLSVDEQYKHPRNLASGSVRQLNSNITKQRFLEFLAFDLICGGSGFKSKTLDYLNDLGFTTVDYVKTNKDGIGTAIKAFNPQDYKYPVDGLIAEYEDISYGTSLGATGHHENRLIALKWEDETVETIFKGIELNPTRTGMVSLTALFDECEIDGTTVSRASVHNVDIFESYEFGIGDTITCYKANQIIPQIEDNLDRTNTYKLPMICPCCGSDLVIERPNDTRILCCKNDNCSAKLVQKFVHFVSKPAMNIEGLSEATLEKFIDQGWLKSFSDIYKLDTYKADIIKLEGFGTKSYEKLWKAIQDSRDVKLENLLVSMGIPQVGKTASKVISKKFGGYWYILEVALMNGFDFTTLQDFGQVMHDSIYSWYRSDEFSQLKGLLEYVIFIIPDLNTVSEVEDNPFKGKKIYGTGSFANYKKEELKVLIEGFGADFTSGYTKSLDYLIVGSLKGSSKEDKAKKDNVRILSEDEFIDMIGGF